MDWNWLIDSCSKCCHLFFLWHEKKIRDGNQKNLREVLRGASTHTMSWRGKKRKFFFLLFKSNMKKEFHCLKIVRMHTFIFIFIFSLSLSHTHLFNRYRDPCSESLNEDDNHTITLVGNANKRAVTLAKTCEQGNELRDCRAREYIGDWIEMCQDLMFSLVCSTWLVDSCTAKHTDWQVALFSDLQMSESL